MESRGTCFRSPVAILPATVAGGCGSGSCDVPAECRAPRPAGDWGERQLLLNKLLRCDGAPIQKSNCIKIQLNTQNCTSTYMTHE